MPTGSLSGKGDAFIGESADNIITVLLSDLPQNTAHTNAE